MIDLPFPRTVGSRLRDAAFFQTYQISGLDTRDEVYEWPLNRHARYPRIIGGASVLLYALVYARGLLVIVADGPKVEVLPWRNVAPESFRRIFSTEFDIWMYGEFFSHLWYAYLHMS